MLPTKKLIVAVFLATLSIAAYLAPVDAATMRTSNSHRSSSCSWYTDEQVTHTYSTPGSGFSAYLRIDKDGCGHYQAYGSMSSYNTNFTSDVVYVQVSISDDNAEGAVSSNGSYYFGQAENAPYYHVGGIVATLIVNGYGGVYANFTLNS